MRDVEDELRKLLASATKALWQVYEAIGCDTDGDETPAALIAGMGYDGFCKMVVRETKEFRQAYDECLDDHRPVLVGHVETYQGQHTFRPVIRGPFVGPVYTDEVVT